MAATALIIDDEPDIRELCALTLTRMGLDCHTASNLEEARNLLGHYQFQVCLTDMRLPDGNGVEFVRYIHSIQPCLPVAVITAHGNMEAAVEAMKNGAYDFVSKPVDIVQLRRLVVQAVSLSTDKDDANAVDDLNNRSQPTTTNSANDNNHIAHPKIEPSDSANSANSLHSEKRLADENIAGFSHETSPESNVSMNAPTTNESAVNEHTSFKRELESDTTNGSTKAPASLATLAGKSVAQLHAGNAINVAGEDNNSWPTLRVDRLIGSSTPIKDLRHMIAKVARTNAPVWITGESGTGKELIARLIHENGPRADGRFVAVNCGAIPSELMESELFGHKKGSFTGATADHEGLFRRAEGGTLFLDEVAELPLHMQVKLLRAIQERSIRPVGASDEMPVDVRVLSASHKDLAVEVDNESFRHDLYYRLNVISIRSPSLREHLDDIEELAEQILDRLHPTNAIEQLPVLSPDAINALKQYHYPGNVRELENLLERAVALSESKTITAEFFDLTEDPSHLSTDTQIANLTEADRISSVLQKHRWNRKAAAEELGLTYRQLRYRIQQLGLDSSS